MRPCARYAVRFFSRNITLAYLFARATFGQSARKVACHEFNLRKPSNISPWAQRRHVSS